MNPRARKTASDQHHLTRGSAHDQANLALCGFHALERVHAQEQSGESGDLVGGHQPGAQGEQERELGDERHHPQPP
jgi:hypothetical protein